MQECSKVKKKLYDGQEVPVSFFSGRVQVRVAQYPGTSAAHSTVTIRESFSPVTGGVAPWADGTDSYTLVVTLTDENGIPQPGYAEDIVSWSTPQSGIVIHDVAEQDDQTYIITVTATEPGNYSLEIRLNYGTYAEPLSQPVELNFLGATIHQPTRTAGSIQSAEGHGFLPGETVTAVAVNYVDRVELGTLTADQNGDVRISFTVPTGFTEGLTTVRFTGETSGTAQIGYRVTDSSLMTFILLGAGALLCLAVVFGLALALRGHRHRAHELR